MALSISRCTSLHSIFIRIPYHATAFSHFLTFLAALYRMPLYHLDLQFLSHSSCVEPPRALWERLDSSLQTVWRQRLQRFTVSEIPVNTGSSAVVWGDTYPYGRYDPVACRLKMAELLPLMHGGRLLFYWDDPHGDPQRVPDRINPFLPVVIAEHIMDFISGTEIFTLDKIWPDGIPATLAACSLTCREWRPRAQAHLFQVVSLTCAQHDAHNIRGFLSLLAKHPALGSFIRTCTVYVTASPKPSPLHNAPFRLLGALSRLEHFRFLNGTFYPPPRIPFNAYMCQSSSIIRLSITNVAFYSGKDLRRIINACRNMKELWVTHCLWRGNPKATISCLYPTTSVRLAMAVLTAGEAEWIKDPRSTDFLEWLAHSGALVSTEDIYLPRFISGAGSMLVASQSVIHTCRSTLTTVRLSLSLDIDYNSRESNELYFPVYTSRYNCRLIPLYSD